MSEDSQTETLDIRQAKLQAVEDYKKEVEEQATAGIEMEALDTIKDVVHEMTLYKTFAGEPMNAVSGSMIEMGVSMQTDPERQYQYGFDDIQELQDLKDRAADALNKAKGTKAESLAKQVFKAVEIAGYENLTEAMMNAESVTF